LEPQITQMIRADSGPRGRPTARAARSILRCLRFLRFRLLLLAVRARKGGMALRAVGYRRRRHGRRPDPGKGGHRLRRTWFLRNRAITLPPGQVSSRRVRPGPGHHPAEGRAPVSADVVFAKLRNDPPAGAGSSRRARRGLGHDPGKDRHRSRRIWICEIAQRPSRRARYGRGHDPGKDGYRSRRTWFLRNCATTLPPGQAPLAGFGAGGGTSRGRTGTIAQRPSRREQGPPAGLGAGGGTTRGKTGTGRGGRGFCEIAQQPSRRGRLFPPGSARAGARPGEGRAQVAADVDLRNCATTLPPGSTRAGARPGEGRAQVAADVVLRNCATTLSPGSTRAGARPGEGRAQVAADVVFAKLRNDPPAGVGSSRRARRWRVFAKCATTLGSGARECALGSGAPRACAMQQFGNGLVAATTGLGLWGRAPSPGSLRDPALVRSSRPKPAGGRGEYGSTARGRWRRTDAGQGIGAAPPQTRETAQTLPPAAPFDAPLPRHRRRLSSHPPARQCPGFAFPNAAVCSALAAFWCLACHSLYGIP
jgi:hypothetical protein